MCLCPALLGSYACPLLVHFNNTVCNILKNAVILSLTNPILTIIVTALNMILR